MASPDHAATVRAFLDNCVPGLTTPDVADAQAALDALVAALDQAEHEREALRAKAEGWVQHDTKAYAEQSMRALKRAERAERQRDQATEALHWLRSLDDPGNEARAQEEQT